MALSKNKIRGILQRNLMGKELTRKEIAAQYVSISLIFLFVIPVYILLIAVLPFSIPQIVKFLIPVLIFGALITSLFLYLIFKARTSDRSDRELAQLEGRQENAAK